LEIQKSRSGQSRLRNRKHRSENGEENPLSRFDSGVIKKDRYEENFMSIKFDGTIDELKEKADQAEVQGHWQTGNGAGRCVFRSNNSGVLNWWSRTGTLQFQGSAKGKSVLEAIFESNMSAISPSELPNASTENQRQIFIVHGHDVQARNDLELALRRLNLSPFILNEYQ